MFSHFNFKKFLVHERTAIQIVRNIIQFSREPCKSYFTINFRNRNTVHILLWQDWFQQLSKVSVFRKFALPFKYRLQKIHPKFLLYLLKISKFFSYKIQRVNSDIIWCLLLAQVSSVRGQWLRYSDIALGVSSGNVRPVSFVISLHSSSIFNSIFYVTWSNF